MTTAASTELDQVVAVATDYLRAFYEGSAEERAARIEGVLHPRLAKRSPSYLRDDGAFREWSSAGDARDRRRERGRVCDEPVLVDCSTFPPGWPVSGPMPNGASTTCTWRRSTASGRS